MVYTGLTSHTRVVYTGLTSPNPVVYKGCTSHNPVVYKGCASHTRVCTMVGIPLIPGCVPWWVSSLLPGMYHGGYPPSLLPGYGRVYTPPWVCWVYTPPWVYHGVHCTSWSMHTATRGPSSAG